MSSLSCLPLRVHLSECRGLCSRLTAGVGCKCTGAPRIPHPSEQHLRVSQLARPNVLGHNDDRMSRPTVSKHFDDRMFETFREQNVRLSPFLPLEVPRNRQVHQGSPSVSAAGRRPLHATHPNHRIDPQGTEARREVPEGTEARRDSGVEAREF